MDWKSLKGFRMSLFSSYAVTLKPAENTITIERRGSNLSEIFGICGPDTAAQPVIGLGTIAEQDPLPSTQELQALYKLNVMDRTRNKTPFLDLVQSSKNRRNIVVFIRHFFCPVRSSASRRETRANANISHRTALDTSELWQMSYRQKSWNRWTRQPLSQSSDVAIRSSSKIT